MARKDLFISVGPISQLVNANDILDMVWDTKLKALDTTESIVASLSLTKSREKISRNGKIYVRKCKAKMAKNSGLLVLKVGQFGGFVGLI